ncbi:MAG TPA: ubiquinone/menaquinone biosynthesis methyltransferase [Anaerolineae bacterium]|nr:ubiquinone/menaquinone biosynthesis methyltransferase [Anaerolineae bacterium]
MTHLQGQERAAYVQGMFARISGRYDLMNRLMTGGRDGAWRRTVIRLAQLGPMARILDVATGTGDMLIEALKQHPDAFAIGSDFTFEMMRAGQSKAGAERIRWNSADALHLPYPDNVFDAVTSGFGVRNFIDRERAFREQLRVVKPGGRVICLEISKPPKNLLRPFFLFFFNKIVPLVGGLISGQRDAYTYLPQSVNEFLTPDELKIIMERAGLRDVRYRRLMMSTVAIHVGIK